MTSKQNSSAAAPTRRWRTRLVGVAKDIVSLTLAIGSALSLCRVMDVLRRNPFGWSEAAELGVSVLCTIAAWGFFRFLLDLVPPGGLPNNHPGLVAWWLMGGIWVTATLVDVVVARPSRASNAVHFAVVLGTVLAGPLLVPLLLLCWRRRERAEANWRTWFGFTIGCLLPFQFVLLLFFWPNP